MSTHEEGLQHAAKVVVEQTQKVRTLEEGIRRLEADRDKERDVLKQAREILAKSVGNNINRRVHVVEDHVVITEYHTRQGDAPAGSSVVRIMLVSTGLELR